MPFHTLPIIAIVMFLYGIVVYQLVIKRVIDNDMFVSLLATFGLSLFMQQVMNLIYGPEVQTVDSHMYIMTMFDDFVTVPTVKIVSLALAAVFATATCTGASTILPLQPFSLFLSRLILPCFHLRKRKIIFCVTVTAAVAAIVDVSIPQGFA